MTNSPTFHSIEQRTLRLINFEDGIWDLMLGMIFLALACYPVTRQLLGPDLNILLFLAVLALLLGAHVVLRRIVTEPRLGRARPRRTAKLRVILAFTAVMFVLTVGLVALMVLSPSDGASPINPAQLSQRGYLVELIVLLALAALFSGLGYATGVPRLYAYGWLIGLGNLASVYMEHAAGWTFMLPSALTAAIILAAGFVQLRRFLSRYPLRPEAG